MTEGTAAANASAPVTCLRVEGRVGALRLEISVETSARAIAIVGPSGAGKTTLLETVLGLRPELAQRIVLAGETLDDAASRVHVPVDRRRLGWAPQPPLLFPHLDVAANLRVGLSRADDPAAAFARAVELLELETLLARRVATLSAGETQRVALARAIASAPRALLLDEPLASLDVPRRARLLARLTRVRDAMAVPTLHVTHDPDEAMILADEVIVLDAGRVAARGRPRDVLWQSAFGRLSDRLAVENVLEGRVAGRTGERATRFATSAGLVLELPRALPCEMPLRIGLRAEEILLAAGPPGRVSARNVIEARVLDCADAGEGVLVTLDASGERIVARVTAAAVRDLGIARGSRLVAVIKAHSLTLLGGDDESAG